MPSLENISLLTLVNNQDIYRENVLKSTQGESHVIEYVWISWAKDAASALNWGLKRCKNNIVLCCHQDVEFYPGWHEKLIEIVSNLKEWGVLGTAGTTFTSRKVGTHSGLNPDKGFCPITGKRIHTLPDSDGDVVRVMTLDCCLIILQKNQPLRFDENLKYYHMYGEDIALQANYKGYGAFVINIPMVHNTKWASGPGLKESKHYLRSKWRSRFGTIYTTIGDI